MERRRALVRDALTAIALLAMLLPVSAAAVVPAGCALTTLEATVVPGADGRLTCGPGESLTVRDDLVAADAARTAARVPLTSFVALADLGVVDEESPLRTEFLDKCGDVPTSRSFRPHESMIPALLESHVRAVGALANAPGGSPNTNKRYDFAVGLGSTTENRQLNELRLAIDLLDGGALIDPDSGADGYEGVQGTDPRGAGDLVSPVAGTSLRDLANEPFVAAGLRAGQTPLPWYDVIGDRDVKLWGVAPADQDALETIAARWATGSLKLSDIGPGHLTRICRDPSALSDPTFLSSLAADPGAARVVTPDAERAPVGRKRWMDEHLTTDGAPRGHGFAAHRCTGPAGAELARGCHAWTQGLIRFIALDTTPAEGLGGANIDAAQFAWLERELRANSSRYIDAQGRTRRTDNVDRAIVILQHHPTSALGTGPASAEGARGGADLRRLLLRYPNVVLQLSANAARHRITSHADDETRAAHWEIETASVAAWPSQSRSIEIAHNADGTLSIYSVMVDAAVPPDARTIDWDRDDPTDERAAGGGRRVNEAWLASAAREIALNDPQADVHGVTGTAADRNVELLVRSPLKIRAVPQVSGERPTIPTFPGFPTVPGFPDLPAFEFPDGFGSIPTPTTSINPFPTFPTELPTLTGPGLAVLPSDEGGWGGRALRLFGIAAVGGWWLWRARVRRWMVGI